MSVSKFAGICAFVAWAALAVVVVVDYARQFGWS